MAHGGKHAKTDACDWKGRSAAAKTPQMATDRVFKRKVYEAPSTPKRKAGPSMPLSSDEDDDDDDYEGEEDDDEEEDGSSSKQSKVVHVYRRGSNAGGKVNSVAALKITNQGTPKRKAEDKVR